MSGDMGGAVYVGIVAGFILFILFGLISLIKDTNKLENRMRAKRERKNKKRR
jgi:TRAP-type C4-dicarboxylate transport system permease small subunit